VEVPDDLEIRHVHADDLTDAWNRKVVDPELRRIGEAWANVRDVPVLSVPSAVIPEERNSPIYPQLPGAETTQVATQRPFDPRLSALRVKWRL